MAAGGYLADAIPECRHRLPCEARLCLSRISPLAPPLLCHHCPQTISLHHTDIHILTHSLRLRTVSSVDDTVKGTGWRAHRVSFMASFSTIGDIDDMAEKL